MVDHSINKQCTEPLFWACETLGTHHSLREQSAGTLVIKLVLLGVHLVLSVLKGADGGAGIAKWSGETGKNRCQPRGQGLGLLPAAGETPAVKRELTAHPAPGEGGSWAGGEGGAAVFSGNRIPRNAPGPDAPPARGWRPFPGCPRSCHLGPHQPSPWSLSSGGLSLQVAPSPARS